MKRITPTKARLAAVALAALAAAAYAGRKVLRSPRTRSAAPAHTGPRVVAYYPGWSADAQEPYEATDIPGDLLTHVNYAFANVDAASGQIALGRPDLDVDRVYPDDRRGLGAFGGNFGQLVALKARYPHLRTLISVGGWTWSGNFSDAVSTGEKRQRLARSCAAFSSRYGFDGVDIDWEYPASDGMQPGRPEDARNFTLMLADLRRELEAQSARDRRPYELTIAAPAGVARLACIELEQIHAHLDFISLMTYDFAGAWSPATGFNAPLYGTTDPDQPQDSVSLQANAHTAVQHCLDRGVPPDKLVLGVPFYGRAWRGVPEAHNGLHQPHQGEAQLTATWRALRANALYGMPRFWHEQARVPWLYDAAQQVMVSYDDPDSVHLKAEYVRERSLGGVMFWQIAADDADHTLLQSLLEGLRGEQGGTAAGGSPDGSGA